MKTSHNLFRPVILTFFVFLAAVLSGQDLSLPALEAEAWQEGRRGEVLELFEEHVYGRVPDMDVKVESHVTHLNREALGGKAVMKEVEVSLSVKGKTEAFTMLVFLPSDAEGPVPLFLGYNFYGNHTIHPDPSISFPTSKLRNSEALHITNNRASDASRGLRASRWPVEQILDRGYGLATIYCGDLDVDEDDDFAGGVHALDRGERDPSSWGTIAAWAWGLSRAMDCLEKDVEVDPNRVAVIGHSRLGKTSLWAGAQDERFALVVSNNSGCGGAALSRRKVGEDVARINETFPHWFADRFNEYNNNEEACPVDQHMLLALVAPRALYVASATEDEWADPVGEYLSLYHGSRVYGEFGMDMLESQEPPLPGTPRWAGKVGYHLRSGKHDITPWDWEQYLDFADVNMPFQEEEDPADQVTMEWIEKELRKESPRLVLSPELDARLRFKLKSGDQLARMGMEVMKRRADVLLEDAPLEFNMQGRRLLGVSREAVRRLTTLALVYRYEKDPAHLARLEAELKALCAFAHWNPSHFLDVGEMAAGIALALDWAGEWISPEVNKLAREALLEKAIKPGLAPSPTTFFKDVHHNWNLVCNGGLALAALCLFEEEPELASRVIHQAVQTMPEALHPYAPDGIYPEGVSYWSYATTYLAVTVSAFESALNTDFGLSQAPGLMESVLFSKLMAGPAGEYYNFFDAGSGGYMGASHMGLLAWFALRSGDEFWVKPYEDLLQSRISEKQPNKGSRFAPYFYLLQMQLVNYGDEAADLPAAWAGDGDEPIGVLRDPENSPSSFFLAAKGGMAADNHGNMDAGSFIFEMDGVRWSVDPGNQSYHELEQLLGTAGLWQTGQDSPRWSLLTKNNMGHSTLTVNGERHLVDARATLVTKELRGDQASFSFDLGPVFGRNMESAVRTFTRSGKEELQITDHLEASSHTEDICWQMVTTADVRVEDGRVVLDQDGKSLQLVPECEVPLEISTVELDPPPLPYDKQITGLKRIEIRPGQIPGDAFAIAVTLSPNTPE